MNTFAALAFTNILQLIAAFKNGAVFEIAFKDGTPSLVITDIAEESAGKMRVTYVSSWGCTFTSTDFREDGRYNGSPNCWLKMVKEADPQPFLKQFVNGTPAYNPKTRETVKSIDFVSGAIKVTLVSEDGIERVSTRYDHEGRHRWVAERSLVLGDLPPKPVVLEEVTMEVFKSLNFQGKYVAFVAGTHSRKEAPIATVAVKVPA
ncbi:hypothetical protein [Achromobacter sp. NFACC18-2]|uniref:hypothetical protein n=1 Tax=Achromobacter sp. NFACC18-2 TaxID=1564112 RepID=UPI0008AC9045|nr:hypothetical protein [Achromobacter sp. NFACC18-2]SEJ84764.1 hypothetical protein SAMN03159494_03556 [Achromobacter sp. NFACC18-2]